MEKLPKYFDNLQLGLNEGTGNIVIIHGKEDSNGVIASNKFKDVTEQFVKLIPGYFMKKLAKDEYLNLDLNVTKEDRLYILGVKYDSSKTVSEMLRALANTLEASKTDTKEDITEVIEEPKQINN